MTATADQILARLSPDPQNDAVLQTSFTHQDLPVALRIDPDGGEMTEVLNIARELLQSIEDVQMRMLATASDGLLQSYNETWRCYSEQQADGSLHDVSNPVLTAQQFEAKLSLHTISLAGETLEFYYADADLFAGHQICVTAFDGLGLTRTHVELIG
ncbi:DUF2262 domain-containing protein [Tritonibacter aquimaris]|uniref:DUF2262 domain-containing protein n=1 Tax=Tritonibacter aquimaris TaxID=2663379 RepID=UPI0018860BAB|nr:DUF2262 domain-containing protein [Tritonibacter aquimaris]